MPTIGPIWRSQECDEGAAVRLASALNIEPAVARLLCQRGLGDAELASRFLNPSLEHLHDPMLLADMRVAVDRIMGAIARKERIAIHGDYDVDGVTSTVILRRALELLGADVIHFIPERLRDGYGLQPAAIDRLHAEGVALIVSVDCGIRGADAARRARELGVDLIVTDHHEPDTELPPALAVINPKRHDCQYPDKYLAGVGVALKLVQALCRQAGREAWLPGFVKVAAIGTLADVVPLVGENRVIAKIGLDLLSKGPHKVGLRALLDVAGLTGKTIDSFNISFMVAPRINAAGRMSTPDIATRLLLASDEAMGEEVRALALQLDGENIICRQEEEAGIVAAARKIVQTDPDIGARSVLVVAGGNWHRGVIGIVASKLVDAFHRPAIVLSIEDGMAQGSCRSIHGFDMLGALERCAHLLLRFGGHKQAAGLALDAERIREFRAAVNDVADETLGPDDLMPRLRIDGNLAFRAITPGVASGVASLAPFGAGNPRPVFAARRVEIVDGPRKLKERHLKMALKQEGRIFRAVAWRAAERHDYLTEHRAALDVAFSLEQISTNGDTYLKLTPLSNLKSSRHMTIWQRRARYVIAIGAVGFLIVVLITLKRREPTGGAAPAARTDPGAVVEVTGGRVERFKLSREDVRVAYERQLTFANGSTKLVGVTISADQRLGGRSFTVTADTADVGQGETTMQLNGKVRLGASDGMTVRTESATYADKEGVLRAPGPVEFSRGRMTGSGTGMTHEVAREVLTILDRAVVHVAADEAGAGAAEVASGSATFARRLKTVRFDRDVKLQRDRQTIEGDAATMYLTDDEQQVRQLEVRGRSRIGMGQAAPGGLQGLAATDMDLHYGADGVALERAVLTGDASIVLAGDAGGAGRQIKANTIDVALAPDGATPVGLVARTAVVLTLPAAGAVPERTIRSNLMDGKGEPGRGLTRAQFTGDVEFRERGVDVARVARSGILDVALAPAMAGITDATFTQRVRFSEDETASAAADDRCAAGASSRFRMCAASIRYDLAKGFLALTGSEPGSVRPRVVNDRIAVDATRIDVALAGPDVKGAGDVKSVVQVAHEQAGGRGGAASPATHLPSMFKQDKPVNVTADALDYGSAAGRATYTGNAQLWQEDTSIKAPTIVLEDKTGDLTAAGGVTTVTVRETVDKNKKVERVRSIATSADFRYEEASRRATYTGKAHMNSPDGDMTAERIELFLKAGSAGGDDLERAEAYDDVTLRDRSRTTTGTRLSYTTADARYVVTGTPVKIVDECRRETIGRTLTYLRAVDTVTIDGNERARTQTKGSSQCP